MVDFDLLGQTFEEKEAKKQDNSFSELKVDNESRGKGKIPSMPSKSRRNGKPPKGSLKLNLPASLSNADKLSSHMYKSARDRHSSAAPGSILKRSGSHFSENRAQSQKKSVIFRDITDMENVRDKSMADSDMESPRPLSGILKNKIPRV